LTLLQRSDPDNVRAGDFGGYTLVDAIATMRAGRGEISAGIENIFDRRYLTYYSQTLTGANADNFNYFAGRGRMLSLRYRVSF
jgi:iron complex outermembrane receptor protein